MATVAVTLEVRQGGPAGSLAVSMTRTVYKGLSVKDQAKPVLIAASKKQGAEVVYGIEAR